ncbi:MAG: DnaB-like helicase C-terminal domain-containing protein [Candidatus Binatia bacterium]
MADRTSIRSEGEQLAEILDALERQSQVKEISGWDTGFTKLSRALDGILPGLYLLIGAPACGKTSFAKQLLDQVAKHNNQPAIFFTFSESLSELRIRTLARLSGMENREIRRGSAYLLHWYGVPKAHHASADELAPSWEKLRLCAEDAKTWLDQVYLGECDRSTTLKEIETQIRQIDGAPFVVIDDCQRLGDTSESLDVRLPIIVEQLQELAITLKLPLLAVWPDLNSNGQTPPQAWADKVASADVIMVMGKDLARPNPLTEANQAITLDVVKNRGGERGKLAFEFQPAFAKFVAAES